LKKVFQAAQVPYPMLIVRNSFMIVSEALQASTKKLQLQYADLFATELQLVNHLVKRDSTIQLTLEKEKENMIALYGQVKIIAAGIDTSLQTHTSALQTQALKKIAALEKKMFRAQKRKFEAQQRQLEKLKKELFPNNNLQERVSNLMPFYATYGKAFIEMIYSHSNGLQQEFGVILQ
jgi:uncharacterized protein YllA (UPF0747 family)